MISIIVPIYNVKSYLEQCIESIIHQTYKDIEIILVDDGSTDGCGEICDYYKVVDDRIVVIHKENGGLVSARKAGIMAATGEYIAYVDGDDWIEPDMYEMLYETMVEEDVDVVISGRYEDTGAYSRKVYDEAFCGKYDKDALKQYVYSNMISNGEFFTWGIYPYIWGRLYKKECLIPIQMQVHDEITVGEDVAVTYPLLLAAQSLYVMKECYYHYRQTTDSMIKRFNDSETEKKNAKILYRTVKEYFIENSNGYNLLTQWDEYILFMMLPRVVDVYEKFFELDYLYPFPEVKRGSKIVLYGASTYGQRLYKIIQNTGFCQVQLWTDRNYVEFSKMGLGVGNPSDILNTEFDYIVIAVTYAKTINAIRMELGKIADEAKIKSIDVELIKSEVSMKAFGLFVE